jgi:hypothetical protein
MLVSSIKKLAIPNRIGHNAERKEYGLSAIKYCDPLGKSLSREPLNLTEFFLDHYYVLCGKKWICFPLPTNGGFRTVPWIDDDIIAEGKDLLSHIA